MLRIGVWENSVFIGVVLFGAGANRNMLTPYGLKHNQGCELTRVALNNHNSFTSQIVMSSIKILKNKYPEFQLVVSYADEKQGHLGKIYQATNWIYTGEVASNDFMINGEIVHKKTVYSKYKTNSVQKLRSMGLDAHWAKGTKKHKYLMPLNKKMRKKLLTLSKLYPKVVTVETNRNYYKKKLNDLESVIFK